MKKHLIFNTLFFIVLASSFQGCKLNKKQMQSTEDEKANREGFNARQANDMVNYREGRKEKDMQKSDNVRKSNNKWESKYGEKKDNSYKKYKFKQKLKRIFK